MQRYKINILLIALYFHLLTQQLHPSDFPKLGVNDLHPAICVSIKFSWTIWKTKDHALALPGFSSWFTGGCSAQPGLVAGSTEGKARCNSSRRQCSRTALQVLMERSKLGLVSGLRNSSALSGASCRASTGGHRHGPVGGGQRAVRGLPWPPASQERVPHPPGHGLSSGGEETSGGKASEALHLNGWLLSLCYSGCNLIFLLRSKERSFSWS